MEDRKPLDIRKLIENAEAPFNLRDRIAIEVLNGIISGSGKDSSIRSDVISYLNYESEDKRIQEDQQELAKDRIEKLIRGCYKVADIMRKVRLSAFE